MNGIVLDITLFKTTTQFDFWHDRAAFHFLATPNKIEKYVQIAEKAIHTNGSLILGAFSENGPSKCCGLKKKQYSATSKLTKFEKQFERIKCIEEIHTNPHKTILNFLFCSFKKIKNTL